MPNRRQRGTLPLAMYSLEEVWLQILRKSKQYRNGLDLHALQMFGDFMDWLHTTVKFVEFKWTEQCGSAINELKRHLTDAPVLVCPSVDKEFQLTTDPSAYGLGAVLEQDGHPVAYASRVLTKAEKN